MKRRELLSGLLATATFSTIAFGGGQTPASADGGWPIKPLPFDPKKLMGISEKLIVSHHNNNYAGAERRIGQIQQMMDALPKGAPGFQIKGLKMEQLIATNSAI